MMSSGAGSSTRRFQLRVSTQQLLSYAPQFVAEALGYFDDEDLEVTFVLGTPDLGLAGAVQQGDADVAMGALLFALRSQGPDGLVPFAQSNQHLRYVVAARTGETPEAFQWRHLRDKVVFVTSQLPTPWVAFREVLQRHDIGLDEVRPIIGYTANEALSEFLDGVGDLLVTDMETAQDPRITEVAAIADELGRVPWSVYCASRGRLGPLREQLLAFTRAVGRAQGWIGSHEAGEVAEVLSPRFSAVDTHRMVGAIARYQRMELWSRTPTIQLEEAERWQEIMVRWGIQPEELPLRRILADVERALGD